MNLTNAFESNPWSLCRPQWRNPILHPSDGDVICEICLQYCDFIRGWLNTPNNKLHSNLTHNGLRLLIWTRSLLNNETNKSVSALKSHTVSFCIRGTSSVSLCWIRVELQCVLCVGLGVKVVCIYLCDHAALNCISEGFKRINFMLIYIFFLFLPFSLKTCFA